MARNEGATAEAALAVPAEPVSAERGPDAAGVPKPQRHPWTPLAVACLLVGGLVSGALSGMALSGPASFEIAQIAAADIDAAAASVPQSETGTHIADAKACRVPMAFVTLRPHPGAAGTVRIQSGSYWSPTIRLGNGPLRIAVPYPAPYEVGRGDLAFEASGVDYDVFLRPGWASAGRQGLSVVHVWWTPKAPC